MKTKVSVKYFLYLIVYNYDASPRTQCVKHSVDSEEQGRTLMAFLEEKIGKKQSENDTGLFLDEQHGISGFVDYVSGLYKETLEQLA